jgi:hypothetical protein
LQTVAGALSESDIQEILLFSVVNEVRVLHVCSY